MPWFGEHLLTDYMNVFPTNSSGYKTKVSGIGTRSIDCSKVKKNKWTTLAEHQWGLYSYGVTRANEPIWTTNSSERVSIDDQHVGSMSNLF